MKTPTGDTNDGTNWTAYTAQFNDATRQGANTLDATHQDLKSNAEFVTEAAENSALVQAIQALPHAARLTAAEQ
ncbi:hypothetical protein [Nocardia carnea]|uniref:hypothetical protein n=1 Tax=Nocardia carnea TaxID=37328 RepID=UPI0002D8EA3C|nr:hypothetical protein [Nocardia carnea]